MSVWLTSILKGIRAESRGRNLEAGVGLPATLQYYL